MRRTLTALAAVVVIVGATAMVREVVTRGELVEQPIAFNHVIHIDDAGMQCLECHLNAESAPFAGIPGKAICFDCHDIDEETGSHPEKDKMFAYDERSEDIPWGRVAITRPDVYFSHRRHVTSAKLDCLECHKDQERLTSPPRRTRLVMTMDDCLECHAKSGMVEDCNTCHR